MAHAKRLGLPLVDLTWTAADPALADLLPDVAARRLHTIPLMAAHGSLAFAIDGTGVHRRRAVYELMRITPAIRALIEPGVNADQIHQAALAAGMVPITQAALDMARKGLISLNEAYRVRAD